MAEQKKFDNRLGIKGWLGGGRWGFERYLYTLHRLSGLGILFYFLLHVLVTSSRAFGDQAWARWMGVVDNTFFAVGEYLIVLAFVFHAMNGIRLVLIELGFAVGPAEEPIYPYQTSLNKQRPLMIVMMALAAVLVVASGYDFWILSHH